MMVVDELSVAAPNISWNSHYSKGLITYRIIRDSVIINYFLFPFYNV